MRRKVILRLRRDDPACVRAQEFVPRVAADLALDFELQWSPPDSGHPLPQLLLWDGTILDHVADEEALRAAIEPRIGAEDAVGLREAPDLRPIGTEHTGRERAAPALVLAPVPDPAPDATPAPGLGRVRRQIPRRLRTALASERARRLLAVGAAVAALLGAGVFGLGPFARRSPPPAEKRPAVAAPPLDLATLDGFRFDLERQRGRAVLVVFFDARQTDRKALEALAAVADRALSAAERARGEARVVAVGVGLGLEELRGVVGEPPRPLTVAADPDGRVAGAFAAIAGAGSVWWLVDRAGQVVARGGQGEWPGPEAAGALVALSRDGALAE